MNVIMNIKVGLGKYIGAIYLEKLAADEEFDDSKPSLSHVNNLINGFEPAILLEFTKGQLVSNHDLSVVMKTLDYLTKNPSKLKCYTSFEQLMAEWEFSNVNEGASSIILTYLEHIGLFKPIFEELTVQLLSAKPI
jgi:hypothetical protein